MRKLLMIAALLVPMVSFAQDKWDREEWNTLINQTNFIVETPRATAAFDFPLVDLGKAFALECLSHHPLLDHQDAQ